MLETGSFPREKATTANYTTLENSIGVTEYCKRSLKLRINAGDQPEELPK